MAASAIDTDVLVVGAGSAGATAAAQIAKAGRSVVLVDRRPEGSTGARWVNGVPGWMFEAAGVSPPSGDELFKTGGDFVMAPFGATRQVVHRSGGMFHVDMRQFVARQLETARRHGAEFLRAVADTFRVEEGAVTVDGRLPDGGSAKWRARLVVDASGLAAVVRRSVAAQPDWAERTGGADRCMAAQYQYRVADRDRLAAFLARYGARPGDDLAIPGVAGGFSTLTLFTRPDLECVGMLTGSIPHLGTESGQQLVRRFERSAPWLGERLFGGAGAIPVRRPLSHLVSPRIALIGDAACQVFGAHGSGVGMGMIAAATLADNVANEPDPGAATGLSGYERSFRRAHGGVLAAADALRRFSQRSPASLAGRALDAGLIDEETFGAALLQRAIPLSLSGSLRLGRRGLAVPRLAAQFGPAVVRALLAERMGGWSTGATIDRVVGRHRANGDAPAVNDPFADESRID
jgi:flavin-dependent dehydrogenase